MIWVLCYLCTGAIYRSKLIGKYHRDVAKFESFDDLHMEFEDFPSKLFDCFKGTKILKRNMFICWCTPVRFAANASATGFMGYWLAIVILSFFLPLLWVFGFISRINLRARFRMRKRPISDCCAWFWCFCCSLVQESKLIDHGFRLLRDRR